MDRKILSPDKKSASYFERKIDQHLRKPLTRDQARALADTGLQGIRSGTFTVGRIKQIVNEVEKDYESHQGEFSTDELATLRHHKRYISSELSRHHVRAPWLEAQARKAIADNIEDHATQYLSAYLNAQFIHSTRYTGGQTQERLVQGTSSPVVDDMEALQAIRNRIATERLNYE